MTAWQVKAAKDSLKAVLPFQGYLRRAKRSVSPYASNPDRNRHLLGDSLRQIAALRGLGIDVTGRAVVEIGSGWVPILPLIYRLFGAARVVTVDQERLIDSAQIVQTVKFIHDNIGAVSHKLNFPAPPLPGSLTSPAVPLEEFFLRARIEYKAPFNFLELQRNSADMVVSRDVLEHIPEAILTRIVNHSFDMLRPGGIACHTIDMSDHWQHVDSSIPKVNFLQYNGMWWKIAGMNSQNFQNRLRRFEYVDIFRNAGFEIIDMSGAADVSALEALGGMRLCARYASVAKEELAILSTTIIARRP